MSNLINTWAYLKEVSEGFDILHDFPPLYIKTLTNKSSPKILFVHNFKEKALKAHVKASTSPESCESSGRRESDEIVGSPLKDDCDVKGLEISLNLPHSNPWEEVESFQGLDVERARGIIQEIINKSVMAKEFGSLWVLCDAKDAAGTLLLELEAKPGWFSRGVVEVRAQKVSKVDIPEIVRRHTEMIRSPGSIEVTCDVFYSFFCNTTLKFTNTDDRELSCVNLLNKSQVVLYQTFHQTENQSLASGLLNQIYILNKIYESIVAFREDGEEQELEYDCGVPGNDLDLMNQKLSEILQSIPEPSVKVDVDFNTRSLIENSVVKVKTRPLIDATDQLWDELKMCGSFRDLKRAFQTVFQVAAKCNVVNMPTASTKLGELIRDICERRIAIPHLTGSQPLELLLETGMEKLTRDYAFIFTESHICDAGELKINKKPSPVKLNEVINVRKSLYNAAQGAQEDEKRKTYLRNTLESSNGKDSEELGFQNSRFCQPEVELKLSRLAQVHFVLEHLLLLQLNLSLDSIQAPITEALLREDPTELRSILKTAVHKIEVPIVDDRIKEVVQGKRPSAKRVHVKSASKFMKLETTQFFSEEPLFPPHVYDHVFPIVAGDKSDYWQVSYTKVGSRLI